MQQPTAISSALSRRISVLRFILIVFIVYLHAYNVQGINFEYGTYILDLEPWMAAAEYILSGIISSAAVPLFFLISGFLFFLKPFTFTGSLKKKFRTVLLPFLLWNSVWVLFFFIGQSIPFFQPYFSGTQRYVAAFGPADWLRAYFPPDSSDVFCSPLWFLSDLFRLGLIALPLKKAADAAPALTLGVFAGLWLCRIDLVFISTEAILFFILGYFIVKYAFSAAFIDAIPLWELTVLYVLGITAQLIWGPALPVLGKLNILIGSFFFIRLSGFLAENRRLGPGLLLLSKYSFIVFVAHEYTQSALKKLVPIYLPREVWVLFVSYLALPPLVVGLCVAFGALFRRALPHFYKLATGSR
jgi:hypothetical protein